VNDELAGMWSEVALFHVEMLYLQSCGGAEEILENPQSA
jgi:hypothetical protein